MAESGCMFSRYFKPSTFISLALCISAAARGGVLLPGESAVVSQGDTPEGWSIGSGSTLTVNSGGQALGISGGGAGSILNLNAGSSTQSINLSAAGSVANITGASIIASSGSNAFQLGGGSAILTDTTVTSANGLGLFGTQLATGPGSSFLINGGAVSGAIGGVSLSFGSSLDATGTVITGTGANSYGVRGFGSDITLRNSTVSGGLNGILYRADVANVRAGTLNVEGTHVEGASGAAILLNGQGGGLVANLNLLNGTTLTGGNGNALEVTNTATANVLLQGSEVTGNIDISNNSTANLTFNQGRLIGNVSADATSTGTLALNNGSALTGDVTGIDSVNLDASAIIGNVTSASAAGVVSLNNGSALTGDVTGIDSVNLDASAITGNVTSASAAGVVSLNNGSALTGNVNSNSVSLDASSMTGNITSNDGAGVVSLANNSAFTGNLVNVDSATIGASSAWNMVASNSINSLVMSGGAVKFGAANEFYQLDVGNLSGNGTFVMDVDYQTNQHDTLNVTGIATGTHELLIAGSGTDPLAASPITVVQTASGDAVFGLVNGPVDVGTWSYGLASTANGAGGTDWYLDPSSKTISPGTRSVLALFNTAPTVWYGELTSLRSRMGELRFNGGQAGGWVRTYGNKYNVADASGTGYQQNQQGISLGADAPLPFGDGQWLIGVLAGYSKSDLDLDRGTSGTVRSTYLGAYTTWMDQDSGYYFDGVLKLNRFRNDSKVSMSDGARSKGDYDTSGVGGSVEFGRHIKLDDGYFVEPYTQLSAVIIQGKDYGLDNGMEAEGDRTRSLLGKVGVTAGRNFTLSNGSIAQPYVRIAGAHEFAKNNEVQVNNNVFNNDLSGSRGELGAGVAVALSERLQLHADFDYAKGENIEQPFGANVGVRYSW
ncbi:MAG TPA: autotransporter outer membrane beta-barrel domain-containing protein [Pseudomonas sp.]|uniref:autotransporter outer membrane beta-barrel domain-containing protein n=1 Tax=Pseudomonas sp. TaxID=306 RepID=UPI002ED9952D